MDYLHHPAAPPAYPRPPLHRQSPAPTPAALAVAIINEQTTKPRPASQHARQHNSPKTAIFAPCWRFVLVVGNYQPTPNKARKTALNENNQQQTNKAPQPAPQPTANQQPRRPENVPARPTPATHNQQPRQRAHNRQPRGKKFAAYILTVDYLLTYLLLTTIIYYSWLDIDNNY